MYVIVCEQVKVARPTLTTVSRSHARMEEFVKMEWTCTPVIVVMIGWDTTVHR